jgi:TRAP-type uncharacterized transport system fused permease subunit
MKKLGYDPAFAAAVEASASTGGQIMPPVMGAGAFIMAGILGIPYFAVAKAAAIPAVLYLLAVYLMVDLEGRKIGLSPLFALSGFIVPYCFIYGPALIMQGTWPEIIQAFITASLGIFSLSVAVEGWFLVPIKNWLGRGALFVAPLLLIKPGLVSDMIGLVILAVEVGWLISRAGKWETLFSKGRII